MKKMTFFLSRKTMFTYTLMAGIFLLCGVVQLDAQIARASTVANPEIAIAQKMNVVAYPMGTYDRDQVKTKLLNILANLRPQFAGNPGLDVRMRYAYVNHMLNDLNLSIAPEITLLTSLVKVREAGVVGGTQQQIAAMYNQMINDLN